MADFETKEDILKDIKNIETSILSDKAYSEKYINQYSFGMHGRNKWSKRKRQIFVDRRHSRTDNQQSSVQISLSDTSLRLYQRY